MNHELLDTRLKGYFEHEAGRGDVSTDQWQRLISEAVSHRQRHWGRRSWNPLKLASGRPLAATAAALVIAVVVGGMSLWISGLWHVNSPISSPNLLYGPAGGGGSPGSPGLPGSPGIVRVLGPIGGPAPRYFDASWTIEKRSYIPGDSISIALTLKNIYHQPIKFNEISITPLTTHMVQPFDNMTSIKLAIPGDVPELLLPGEELVLPIIVPPALTSDLATGRYAMHLDLRIAKPGDTPEFDSESRLGMNSGTLFVIVPPEGALIKTVQVGEVRQAGGITMTLESLSFGPEETTIVMIVALPDSAVAEIGTPSPNGQLAPVPTLITSERGISAPAPAATPAPRAPGSNLRGVSAVYRLDGGAWQQLTSTKPAGPPEAMYVEWTMGPVSSTARTFDFSITGMRISPGEEVTGPWEWTVSLQNE